MAAVRKKIIHWGKLVDKVSEPYQKKFDAIFKAHKKEAKLMTIAQSNKLWDKKYKNKYDKIEKQWDKELDKIYYKYHNKNNEVKKGYILKIK